MLCHAVLLAGGKSSRFGTNKAFALFNGKPMIEHVMDTLQEAFQNVLIMTNTPEDYHYLGVPVLTDEIPYRGPLGAIESAFEKTKFEKIFVSACDLPLLKVSDLLRVAEQGKYCSAAIPVSGEQKHYLTAVYGRDTLPLMKVCLEEGVTSMHEFCRRVSDKIWVPVEGDAWSNINTPLELAKMGG